MALIAREDLKTYILTSLGWPVVSVELDELNIGQAINNAVDEYLATGAVERAYLPLQASSVNEFDLPKEVGTVSNVIYANANDMISGVAGSSDIFSFTMGGGGGTFGAMMGQGYGNFIHGAGNLAVFFEYMQNRNRVLGKDITFRVIDNKLYVWPFPRPGDTILVEYSKNTFGVLNSDGAVSTSNQWGIYWIKRMALAQCKKMLGLGARGKYSTLAGATGESQQLNAAELLTQAKEEIEALREELASHVTHQQFFIA